MEKLDIEEIRKIAKEAGEVILEYYQKPCKIKDKEPNSPLTKADLAADKIIHQGLKQFDWPILSEETADDLARLEADDVWIIDPLDGTSDFLQKTDEFAVMIGLSHKGQPVLGVVYIPTEDVFYFAEKGKGAFREKDGRKEKIEVSTESDFTQMKILISRNHLGHLEMKLADELNLIKQECGSAGVKMAKISEGKSHIYINSSDKSSQWDTCAGVAILQEAGGKITDLSGNELEYNVKEKRHLNGYVASNGVKHDEILLQITNFLPIYK